MRKYFQGLGRTKWGIGKNKQTNKQTGLSNTNSESILSSVKHIPHASMDRQTESGGVHQCTCSSRAVC